METADPNSWRKCNMCKKPILFSARYYKCNVSTCNTQATAYVFCTVACFDAHLPGARHRDAFALEEKAPARAPARTVVATKSNSNSAVTANLKGTSTKEVLIIASRLKDYIQARAEMNTSASVMEALSDFVRVVTDRAIDNARADGRKTVLDRDFDFLKKAL